MLFIVRIIAIVYRLEQFLKLTIDKTNTDFKNSIFSDFQHWQPICKTFTFKFVQLNFLNLFCSPWKALIDN